MSTLVTILHIIVSLFLILTILLQSGKGGGMGGAFGGSNAGTVFGGSGASTFLRKMTATAATIFMSTSIVLAFLASHDSSDALEKFGRSQAELAKKKEEAKAKALLEGGSGAGSAVAPTMGLPGLDMGSAAPTPDMPPPATGSADVVTPPSPTPPNNATGSATAAGKASTVDPTRPPAAGIGMPNTPGTQAPKNAPKTDTKTDTSTTPSTAPAPAAKDTSPGNNATGSAAPADSTPNAPK